MNRFFGCAVVVFLAIFTMFVAELDSAPDASKSIDELFVQLNEQAIKLNALISRYQANGVLDSQDQENYANTLVFFKNEMQAAADQGYSKSDIAQFNKTFTDVYDQWAQVMLSDQTLLDAIAQAGTNQQPSIDPDSVYSLRISKVTDLYQNLYNDIMVLQQKFQEQMSSKIDSIGGYSGTSQIEFLNTLEDAFKSFVTSVGAKKTFTKNQYFTFLIAQNPSFNPDSFSANDKQFLKGVDHVTQDSIACQRALMLDITSKTVKKNMIDQLQKALVLSQLDNAKVYQDTLDANKKGLDSSWWSELKDYGQDLLKDFSKEFKKELLNQTKIVITDQGGQLIEYIGGNRLYPITVALKKQLAKLSDQLKIESITQFLQDLTPATRSLKFVIRLANPVPLPTSAVQVATSIDLSDQEKTFTSNRLKKIQPILAQEFGITQPLRMAFCCSGGGNRAMIGTMGIFQAAAKAKILQTSMYMVGLSGSTWLIAPWSYLYLQGTLKSDFETSLQQIVDNWTTVLNDKDMVSTGTGMYTPACLKGKQASDFSRQVALRLAYNEPISVVDLYGAMVGNFALDMVVQDKLKITWSSIAKTLQNGDIPLPICSSVFDLGLPSPKITKEYKQYGWYEVTPFQTGGTQIGYIPTQYLGSTFINGKLDTSKGQLRPEYPLSFILGVCGSAFSITLDDVIDKKLPNPTFKVVSNEITLPVDSWVRTLLDSGTGSGTRGTRPDTLHARFANFSADLSTSVLKNSTTLGLFDAGVNFNFPLPVLLDRVTRYVDLVFIYDSSPGDEPALKNVAAYYKGKGNIAVPDMSNVTRKALMANAMTVFNDPRATEYDAKTPTFIYFPTRGFDVTTAPYITPNFKYTQDQMEALINSMDQAFTSQVPEIKKIMQLVAKARYQNS